MARDKACATPSLHLVANAETVWSPRRRTYTFSQAKQRASYCVSDFEPVLQGCIYREGSKPPESNKNKQLNFNVFEINLVSITPGSRTYSEGVTVLENLYF